LKEAPRERKNQERDCCEKLQAWVCSDASLIQYQLAKKEDTIQRFWILPPVGEDNKYFKG
jgi:hypothetical protein